MSDSRRRLLHTGTAAKYSSGRGAAGDAHFLLAGALARLGQHAAAAVSYRAAAAAARADLLGGRELAELVELCEKLANASAEAPQGSEPVGAAGGPE